MKAFSTWRDEIQIKEQKCCNDKIEDIVDKPIANDAKNMKELPNPFGDKVRSFKNKITQIPTNINMEDESKGLGNLGLSLDKEKAEKADLSIKEDVTPDVQIGPNRYDMKPPKTGQDVVEPQQQAQQTQQPGQDESDNILVQQFLRRISAQPYNDLENIWNGINDGMTKLMQDKNPNKLRMHQRSLFNQYRDAIRGPIGNSPESQQ